MKTTLFSLFGIVMIILMSSCSTVRFYSDGTLTTGTGLKYYSVRPYLQVEREISSGSVVKASVFYLPDLEHPQFMLLKSGLGSARADIKLEGGTITSFGVSADPDLSGAITALANLIAIGTSAAADIAGMRAPVPGAAPATVTEIYEIAMINGVTSVRKLEFNQE